jgi:predicted deacylase
MKSFRKFIVEESNDSVEQYFREFEDAVSSTHKRFDENGHTFFIPLKFGDKPNKLVASNLQGDEPAGPVGLLKYVKENKPTEVNVTYLPIVSKESYRSGKHNDDSDINPNNNIPNNPSREMKRLLDILDRWLPLARDGFVDLHEDPNRDEGYMFVWSDSEGLGDRMVNIIGKKYSLLHNPFYPNHAIDGKIEKDQQGMLGDYLATIGVKPSMTTETPAGGGFPLAERADVQVQLLKEFLK